MNENTKNELLVRDVTEENRAATMLELFYDLIFVVAIAKLATVFHHDFAQGNVQHATVSFVIIFFSIWWAWNQYTWFASSFDNNSTPFRLVTMWQMLGALLLAVGVKKGFNGDFSIIVAGYVIIRLSGIYMWLKVAKDNPHLKVTARRYALGIFLCQIGWVTQAFFPFSYVVFALLWLAEFLVPYLAESHTQTEYHPEHIEERFGLLTIIVLGESILASTYSLEKLFKHFSIDLLLVAFGCVFTIFGAWWLYFNSSVEHKLRRKKVAFQWGYGHVVIFASAAAIGAMVSVNVDVLTDHASVSIATANLGFAVSVALFLFGLWFCQERIVATKPTSSLFLLLIVVLVIILGMMPYSIFSIGILMVLSTIYRLKVPLITS